VKDDYAAAASDYDVVVDAVSKMWWEVDNRAYVVPVTKNDKLMMMMITEQPYCCFHYWWWEHY